MARNSIAALVYVAAFGPDADETTQGLQEKFPATDIFSFWQTAGERDAQQPSLHPGV